MVNPACFPYFVVFSSLLDSNNFLFLGFYQLKSLLYLHISKTLHNPP